MDHISKYISPEIKLSSYHDTLFKSELVFDHHMLVWFISGETKIIQAEATHQFKTGDIFFIPRNKPTTVINYPTNGLPHQTVVMLLSNEVLKNFYSTNKPAAETIAIPGIKSYSNHPLLKSCLASLIPYFEVDGLLPENIARLKITEALSIIRTIDPGIDGILANFEHPHKVELVSFMEKHYPFNLPLEKFAYLTGRSLSSFKRDFQKAFNSSPQKWLTRKRLELAHYYLAESRRKPVDVCFEAGFENLSHFSHAFKKHFGYPPTHLL